MGLQKSQLQLSDWTTTDDVSDIWVTIVMIAQVVFQEHNFALFKSVETTDHLTGLVGVSSEWLFMGPKLDPQIMLTLPFSKHTSQEEAHNSATPVQNPDYFTFLLPPIAFPHTSDHSAPWSYKYPEPLALREVGLRPVLPCPHLNASWINSFSAANLSVSVFALQRIGQTNPAQ